MHRTVTNEGKDITDSVCNKKNGRSMDLHLSFQLTEYPFNKKKAFSGKK